MGKIKYTLLIDGQVVALVIGTKENALREILYYFNQYLTEGFKEIKVIKEQNNGNKRAED